MVGGGIVGRSETPDTGAVPARGDIPDTFGMLLRRRREAAGLTLEELAGRAGLTAKGVGALERGDRRRPYPHTVRALTDALCLPEAERAALIAAVPSRAEPPPEASYEPPPAGGPRIPAPDALPALPTALIGRDADAASVRAILVDEEERLVTLTGPGGVGKTSLALRVAGDARAHFPDGVAFVPLAPLADPALVPEAIASALELRVVGGTSVRALLREALRDKGILLVLDNMEHLLGAAMGVADLLAACPRLVVLATSRAPLRLRGEREYPTAPLALPDLGIVPSAASVAAAPSARLFVERAGAGASAFALTDANAAAVAAICRRLDGLPLALELAAARVRMLGPTALLARLDRALPLLTGGARDLPERQRTMRDAVAWSYDLLDAGEQTLFRRLAVFAGGWTLDAAEVVGAKNGQDAEDVLRFLDGLVEQALVTVEQDEHEPRFGMLEPIRQYGLEQLERCGEGEDARHRHALFFLALAEAARPRVRGHHQVMWLARLGREHDDLRATLAWAIARQEAEVAARLGFALEVFWWIRGYQHEGRRWMDQVLPMRDKLSTHLQSRAIMAASTAAYGEGDDHAAMGYAEELLDLARQLGGDPYAEAFARTLLGLLATKRGDYACAAEHLERTAPLFHEAGDEGMASQAYSWTGTLLLLQGDHGGARRRFDEGLALGRRFGDRLGICNALFNLAQLALSQGAYDEAARWFEQGIEPSREMGDRPNVAHILEGLGVVAGLRGEAGRAARLFGAADGLIAIVGVRGHSYYRPDRSRYDRAIAAARAQLDERAFEAAWAEGRGMTVERAAAYALQRGETL